QKEVAERLGVSPSLVSKWEKGERKPDDGQFWELGRFFGVTASFLQKQHTTVNFRPRTQMVRNSSEQVLFGSALNDAAQQIEYLHEAWDLAGRTPRRFAMALEYADTMLVQLADTVRKYLQLNEKITYSELRNALAEKDVLVFEWKLPPKLSGLSFQRDFSVIFINSQN
ncbi:MAG: XRE family transcriptional regulator, partial [Proteobacteria bacterium]|nr:XRE family transcriptional regulator [Pseudomonadota bacterium]